MGDNKLSLRRLENVMSGCTNCDLCKGRNNVVCGSGSYDSDIFFIGEAPGEEEDKYGVPFIGRSGKLLDEAIVAAGSMRANVYISNIVKCRPPYNRDPKPEEVGKCISYLLRQIELIRPTVICCLGLVAAKRILNNDSIMMRDIRGDINEIVLANGMHVLFFATYHPAAILRNNNLRTLFFNDIQKVLRYSNV